MGKCFAYNECTKNGILYNSCEILKAKAFNKVQGKRGKCCMKNCPFYKEERHQIRSDIGIYNMTDKQKRKAKESFDMFYKGVPNIRLFP